MMEAQDLHLVESLLSVVGLWDLLRGFIEPAWHAIWTLVKIVAIIAPLMLGVAYYTLAERKVLPYQTYIKLLLREGLDREEKTRRRA